MMSETCPFCHKLASERGTRAIWDRPFLESTSFEVWPSVGSLVEGWMLVVPKDHYIAIGALPQGLFEELDEVLRSLIPILEQYGPPAFFEHGPAQPQQPVGCGVDHAHLHVVPTQCNLLDGARKILPSLDWSQVRNIRDTAELHLQGLPYLYLEQPLGKSFIATSLNIPSQLFRKVIAAHVGRPDGYDWRHFPEESNVRATIRKLSATGQHSSALGRQDSVL